MMRKRSTSFFGMGTSSKRSTWLAASVRSSTRVSRSSADSLVGSSMTAAARESRSRRSFFLDRKSVVSGKSVSVRVDLGGRRIIKKKIYKIRVNKQTELIHDYIIYVSAHNNDKSSEYSI